MPGVFDGVRLLIRPFVGAAAGVAADAFAVASGAVSASYRGVKAFTNAFIMEESGFCISAPASAGAASAGAASAGAATAGAASAGAASAGAGAGAGLSGCCITTPGACLRAALPR